MRQSFVLGVITLFLVCCSGVSMRGESSIPPGALSLELEQYVQPLDILFMIQSGGSMLKKGDDLKKALSNFMSHLDTNTDWRIAVTSDDPDYAGCVRLLESGKLYIEKSDYESNSETAKKTLESALTNPYGDDLLHEGLFSTLKAFNLFKDTF